MVSTFERFCLATHADRARFDGEIARVPEAEKVSSPSLFSGVELNRRWKIGPVNLEFLDAPPPAGRSCGVGSGRPGGYEGPAIVARIAASPGVVDLKLVEGDVTGFARWMGRTRDGGTVIVNNRRYPAGGDVELILQPAS